MKEVTNLFNDNYSFSTKESEELDGQNYFNIQSTEFSDRRKFLVELSVKQYNHNRQLRSDNCKCDDNYLELKRSFNLKFAI